MRKDAVDVMKRPTQSFQGRRLKLKFAKFSKKIPATNNLKNHGGKKKKKEMIK